LTRLIARALLCLLVLAAVAGGGWHWASVIEFERGKKFYDSKDWYQALSSFQNSVRIFPWDPEPHRYLAKTYIHLLEGRNAQTQVQLLKKAEWELEQAISIEARYPYYWYELARVSEWGERLGAEAARPAIFSYHQALTLDPNNPVFLLYTGRYLLNRGEKGQAKSLLIKLISVDQYSALELSSVWLMQGYSPEELIDYFSVDEEALIKLANVFNGHNRNWAEMVGKKAYDHAPDNPRAILLYSSILSRRGECEKTREILQPLFSQPEYRASAHINYASCLYATRQYALAENEYLQLIRLLPRSLDARQNLAMICLNSNRTNEAKEHLIWLISQPEFNDRGRKAQCYLNLAGIYEKENNLEEALKYYHLYLDINSKDRRVAEKVRKLENFQPRDIIYSPWGMNK